MKKNLSDEAYKKLVEHLRKKLRSLNINFSVLSSIDYEEKENNLVIYFNSSQEIVITQKVRKNLGKEIADVLYKEKICKLYKNSNITLNIKVLPVKKTESLFDALASLQPQSGADPIIIQTLQAIKNKTLEPEISTLITLLGGCLWPEVIGKKVDQLYKNKAQHLSDKESIEFNASCESKFLFTNYQNLIINLRDFFENNIIPFCKKNQKLTESGQQGIKSNTEFLVQLHQYEFQLAQLWKKHKYFLARFKILQRVCQQLNQFYENLNPNDIAPSMWKLYEDSSKEIPAAHEVIQNLINEFIESVKSGELIVEKLLSFFDNQQSIYEQNITEQKIKLIPKEQSEEYKVEDETLDEPWEDIFASEDENPNRPSPDKKEAKDLARINLENLERRSRLKEERKLTSPEKTPPYHEEFTDKKVETYSFQKNGKELFTFSLDIEHQSIYLINSKMKFYAIDNGLIKLSTEFLQILQNKEDRQFLVFNHKGKSGLKLLRENIIVIKPKSTSDRMLLVGINKNDHNFFIPAATIKHDQWETYASLSSHKELDDLTNKINNIFNIGYYVNSIKIKTPEKTPESKVTVNETDLQPSKKRMPHRLFPEPPIKQEKEEADVSFEEVQQNIRKL